MSLAWIENLRSFIALRDIDALIKAKDMTQDTQVRHFLAGHVKREGQLSHHKAGLELAKRLRYQGRRKEGNAIELLTLNYYGSLAQIIDRFPAEKKKERINKAFAACQKCVVLAQELEFTEVWKPRLSALFTDSSSLDWKQSF